MSYHGDETQDLLGVIADKDAEITALHDEMEQLLGQWMFAEEHSLKIKDIVWLQKHSISVRDCPDGEWALYRGCKCLQKADSVRKAIDVLRAFDAV